MLRFANSEEGTAVWTKRGNGMWIITYFPSWNTKTIYVTDDEYAGLRKESIDTCRPIQIYTINTREWVTPSSEIEFTLPRQSYRLEVEEFEYPIYKIGKENGRIVKFTDLSVGTIIKVGSDNTYYVGYKTEIWVKHTEKDVWEDTNFREPIYYYQWEKQNSKGRIIMSDYITDEHAEMENKSKLNWRRIESSKREWKD